MKLQNIIYILYIYFCKIHTFDYSNVNFIYSKKVLLVESLSNFQLSLI